ncbi:MAG: hypothetical protein JWM41_962 [Gemmatimonadetes bacterium]|nr:hypothetical protein [Gemmatimonadota bacterium]
MTSRTHRTFAALLATALLAGCGSDSPTSPAAHQPVDLAAIIAQSSSGGINSIAGASTLASIPTTLGAPAIVPSVCTYSSTTTGFTCPPINTAGVTFNITYYLADAAGHSQSQVDVNTTASVRTVTDASGTIAVPSTPGTGTTIALTNHSDMTLSGLLTTSRLLNGRTAGHFDVTTTPATGPAVHSIVNDTSVTANVAFPAAANTTSSWPTSGTITSDTHTTTTVPVLGSVNATVHSVITFNGTNHPTMTVSVGGVPVTCTLDLSGQTAPTCS